MKRLSPTLIIALLVLITILTLSGCNNDKEKQGQGNNNQAKSKSSGHQVKKMDVGNVAQGDNVIQTGGQEAVIPVLSHEGNEYIPLRKLAELLEFKYEWDSETQRALVGDNDVAYEIPTGSTDALKEGEYFKLSNPPVSIDDVIYIPRDAVDTLFGEAMNHTWTDQELRIKPSEEMSSEEAEKLPDFQDDPNDPNKLEKEISFLSTEVTKSLGDLALTNIDSSKLIRTAKKYIGVKYDFGAGPYEETNRFDCSTYTQYVYGKHNVTLPRLSRSQAKMGNSVSKSNLRVGDLMFFYLPGRYKSNDIVGHVGIYMGNGQMIHSSNKPKDGVQITSINKAFWKKTYLKSRRVAS